MARNGSGTYSLPAGQPVVTGTVISSTTFNTLTSDIATALTGSIAADGQTPATGNLPMATFHHTGVGKATAVTDYSRTDQVQNSELTYLSAVAGVDTITASASIAPSAYAAGQVFQFVSAGANTGAATLNVNSLGAKAITKNGTTVLVAGDIANGATVEVVYDGTRFQLAMGLQAGDIGVTVQGYGANLQTLNNLTLAQGDILTAAAVGTVTNLAKGTTLQQLRMNVGATAPEWFTPAPIISVAYDSGNQTITAGGALTLTHSLGVAPKIVQCFLHCTSNELNYTAGDFVVIAVGCYDGGTSSASIGASVVPDATNINVRFGSANPTFAINNKTSGAINNITNANWAFVVRAYA